MTTVKTFLSRCLLRSRKSLVTQNQVHQTARVIATSLHTSSSQRRTTVPEASRKSQLAALKERGLINTTVLRHVKSPGVKCLDIVNNGKHIDITWEDGHKSKFHAIWLRHSCHSASSRLDHNGMICSKPEDIDMGTRVVSAEIEDNNEILLLKWHYSDGRSHEGPIPLACLRNSCLG